MTDVTESTLLAATRALRNVVAPALDPGNAIAQEQLRLAIEYVEFAASRAEMIGDRNRFELAQYRAMAQALLPFAEGASERVQTAFTEGLTAAAQLKPAASAKDTRVATAALTRAIRLLLRAASHYQSATRSAIERTVLEGSAELIAFERAWYLPLGFDPSPNLVEPKHFFE